MFVADFVGNPAMNFVDFQMNAASGHPELQRAGIRFLAEAEDEAGLRSKGPDVIVGIRPEDVLIGEEGNIPAKVISSFPYGMETTVIVECMGTNLRSVVFGSINFSEGEEVKVNISGTKVCIFHKGTRELISLGKIECI